MEDGGQIYDFSFEDVDVGTISSVYLVSHGDDQFCVDSVDINDAFSWDPWINECFSYTGNDATGCEVVQFLNDDNEEQSTQEPCLIIPPTPDPTAISFDPTQTPSLSPAQIPFNVPSLSPSPTILPSSPPTGLISYSVNIDVG